MLAGDVVSARLLQGRWTETDTQRQTHRSRLLYNRHTNINWESHEPTILQLSIDTAINNTSV